MKTKEEKYERIWRYLKLLLSLILGAIGIFIFPASIFVLLIAILLSFLIDFIKNILKV